MDGCFILLAGCEVIWCLSDECAAAVRLQINVRCHFNNYTTNMCQCDDISETKEMTTPAQTNRQIFVLTETFKIKSTLNIYLYTSLSFCLTNLCTVSLHRRHVAAGAFCSGLVEGLTHSGDSAASILPFSHAHVGFLLVPLVSDSQQRTLRCPFHCLLVYL